MVDFVGTGKEYTSYCGLCCLDCIPSNRGLFARVRELKSLLEELQFANYARLKSGQQGIFGEYTKFLAVLHEIGKLECQVPCRSGGGKGECDVRDCVLTRDYEGCWECDQYGSCEKLDYLKKVHPNLEYHLELIKDEGIESWSAKRSKHYVWE
jgi:hypothetical protein